MLAAAIGCAPATGERPRQVGVPPGIQALGSGLVHVFNTRYPEAAVTVIDASDRELAQRFEQGELDLVLLRAPAEGLLPEGPDRTVSTLAWSALAIVPPDTAQPTDERLHSTSDSVLFHLWRTLDGLPWSTYPGEGPYEVHDLAGGIRHEALGLPGNDGQRVRPSASTIADRSYPAVHRIVVLHRPREKDALHAFHTWLLGEDGQRVVLRTGIVPGILPERRIEVLPEVPVGH